MYAFIVESYGKYGCIVPQGKTYVHKLRNKTRRGWMSETKMMRKRTNGQVFILNDYTDTMKTMSERQLANYVMENYITILPKEESNEQY